MTSGSGVGRRADEQSDAKMSGRKTSFHLGFHSSFGAASRLHHDVAGPQPCAPAAAFDVYVCC